MLNNLVVGKKKHNTLKKKNRLTFVSRPSFAKQKMPEKGLGDL